ncbi:hypothetical protein AAFF_G00123880 [Aldrovandia affinis]|uniref:Uncharacterized protein n=1 Tax=Aldrovandia affinis TaxID=143900 RepID=A0AAD7RS23_9TELE|nr:hypothetical protein AAFF_G00123880 [Aldrovandia affinis]
MDVDQAGGLPWLPFRTPSMQPIGNMSPRCPSENIQFQRVLLSADGSDLENGANPMGETERSVISSLRPPSSLMRRPGWVAREQSIHTPTAAFHCPEEGVPLVYFGRRIVFRIAALDLRVLWELLKDRSESKKQCF